jgi:hypothetical protein
MKQFLIGSAFLLFILSLPAGATNDHAISVVAPKFGPQKVAFLTSFGDTLPPIGYVNFCREHHPDCLPERKFRGLCPGEAARTDGAWLAREHASHHRRP